MEFLEKLRRGISAGWKKFVDFWIDESEDDEAQASERPDGKKQNVLFEEEAGKKGLAMTEEAAATDEEETLPTDDRSMKEKMCAMVGGVKGKIGSCWRNRTGREKMAILFLCGAVLGAGVKVLANNRITIGYRDYTAKAGTYDFIQLQKNVAAAGGSAAITGGGIPSGGGSCAQ